MHLISTQLEEKRQLDEECVQNDVNDTQPLKYC